MCFLNDFLITHSEGGLDLSLNPPGKNLQLEPLGRFMRRWLRSLEKQGERGRLVFRAAAIP